MLKEFFDRVVELCTDQAQVTATPVSLGVLKRSKTYWDPSKKVLIETALERPDNRHTLLNVASVIQYVRNLIDHSTGHANIWVGPESVTIECNENDPKDIVRMHLKLTPLMQLLERLKGKPSVQQTEAIRLLRQQFATVDVNKQALTAARSLKLSSSTDAETEQTHISDRIGKSIRKEASGAGQLPEYLDVPVTAYLSSLLKDMHTVRVWLSIDFKNEGNILFEPDATQMDDAMVAERVATCEQLNAELPAGDVSVYEGEYFVS